MQSSLEIIDRRVSQALAVRRTSTDLGEPERAQARIAATKRIAGFLVFDEATERAALDKMIADRQADVEAFGVARTALSDKLQAAGVSPLAVVPTDAWAALCVQAKLFRMKPDKEGGIRVSRAGLDAVEKLPMAPAPAAVRGQEPKRRWWEAAGVAELVAPEAPRGPDWASVLALLMPGYIEQPKTTSWKHSPYGGYDHDAWLGAHVVLPEAPVDVAATLIRAAGAGFALQTAAVADAIRFRETLGQLRAGERALAADEARRAEALRADPIIYTEADGATAIVAQFGDFPIEQAVVDTVVASDKLFARSPQAAGSNASAQALTPFALGFQDPSKMLHERYLRMLQAQAMQQRPSLPFTS